MKKIYALTGALALTASVFAQNKTLHGKVIATPYTKTTLTVKSKTAIAAAGDTVGLSAGIISDFLPEFAKSGQLTRFTFPGGNVFGKNKDSLNYCAQGWLNINNTPLVITKALFWVFEKGNVGNPASKVRVELFDMANNKAVNGSAASPTTAALNSKGPNVKKSYTDVMWSDIDTTGNALTVATFSAPVSITGDFAIAVNSQFLLDGDTIGILADKVGDAANLDYAFQKFARPNGGSISANWICTDFLFSASGTGSADVTIAMFAVLGNGTAVNEYFNGSKLNAIYPNPSTDVATISYSLENDSKNVSLIVFDSKGSIVFEQNNGTQTAGDYKVTLDNSKLSSGSYYYQLSSNGYRITKELVISK